MRYEGPIYRPPSEADSLLIQATIGCPHNKCTFCMVYKDGIKYKVRKVDDIKENLDEALNAYGPDVKTLFFPAGNTIAMKTDSLCEISEYAYRIFPHLERITVYGSSQFIHAKGPADLKRLFDSGLTRIHVGLESGNDDVLKSIKKGVDARMQIEAGQWVMETGIELSLYVILGIGGKEKTNAHAIDTAMVLNEVAPDFIRLRTFVPKVTTKMLEDVQNGDFIMLSPHEVLRETALLIKNINVDSYLVSDHYTNYLNVEGRLPEQKEDILNKIESALKRDQSTFRPFFVGNQ